MKCIFCKSPAAGNVSTEHIIPESLGNTKLTLKPGIVCDKCNNYFSREVEAPFLNHPVIKSLRFNQALPSKKGRVPATTGLLFPNEPAILARERKTFNPHLFLTERGTERLFKEQGGTLVLPAGGEVPSGPLLSRFMAKVALEAMAKRLEDHPDGIAYLADETQLDLIRNHAKRGETNAWPVHVRRIYDSEAQYVEADGRVTQMVHESDILLTDTSEWYFVLCLFGLELTINYGGPNNEGYVRWLKEHGGASPLYHGRNSAYRKNFFPGHLRV
jgi:HNH endonuclease